jgi:hypothetical protein
MNPFLLQPVPTGDATARYERLSHGGTTWYDLMPTPANGTDGTAGAAFTWPNFNGESFVTIGNPAKLNFAGAFTLCAWAYQDSGVPHQGTEFFIGKDGGLGRDVGLTSADNANDIKGFVFEGGFASAQYTSAGPGSFYYLTFVNEGPGNDLKLYIDGVLRATNSGKGVEESWSAGTAWEFGRDQRPDDYLTGILDTGRFYSRALSPDEILRDYHAGKPAHP